MDGRTNGGMDVWTDGGMDPKFCSAKLPFQTSNYEAGEWRFYARSAPWEDNGG